MTRYTEDNPYGYWIGRDEIIPVVMEESHAEVAAEKILAKMCKDETKLNRFHRIYKIMFRLGYVRVVNGVHSQTFVEYWGRARLSKLQKDFVNDAEYIDCIKDLTGYSF